MIFSTGLKKIYESIGKQAQPEQKKLYSQLESKLLENKILAYKFDLLESIQSKKGKFNSEVADKFISFLKNKHESFLKENNSVALFYKEEKKLFEFFNINQKDVTPEKLDLIVNKKDNALNETIIKEYITNPKSMSGKQTILEKKDRIKEKFIDMKLDLNEQALNRQLRHMNILSDMLDPKNRKLVKQSIRTIQENVFSNMSMAIDKGYKLRILTEKLLREYTPDDDVYNIATDKEWNAREDMPGKNSKLGDIGVFKNVIINIPKGANSHAIELYFSLPIYPTSATMANLMVESRKLDKVFFDLKNKFQRNVMYNANLRLLTPVNLNWDVKVGGKNNNPQSPSDATGKQIAQKGYYSVDVDFEIVIFINKKSNDFAYENEVELIMEHFSEFIQNYDVLSDVMTPDVQKGNLASATGGRATSYGDRSGADQYYKDTHGELSDTDTDDFFSGEADESEIKHKNDNEFFGDAQKGWKPTKKVQPKKQVGAVESDEDLDDTRNAANVEGIDDEDDDEDIF